MGNSKGVRDIPSVYKTEDSSFKGSSGMGRESCGGSTKEGLAQRSGFATHDPAYHQVCFQLNMNGDILKLSCLCWMLILIEHILHVNGYIFKGLVIAAEFLHISVLRGILMDTDTIRFAEQPINGHQDVSDSILIECYFSEAIELLTYHLTVSSIWTLNILQVDTVLVGTVTDAYSIECW
ncbi:unnamed protein product [Cylindrotheca closterium]|uniref:Uncharacterized protein n=1 Tax=Cylindrotheca closterium TaxID=2856 RepID=A0AAD2G094_9STRA|nr:unnamed protein product [Cylindrotheca closterium]